MRSLQSVRPFVLLFALVFLFGSAELLAQRSSQIETVEKLRSALEQEDFELAKLFLTEDPRVWYDSPEGEGFPWTLRRGRWANWDEHFNGVSTQQGPLQEEKNRVWTDYHEMNDYFRLTFRGGGHFRKTWFFATDGKVKGYMISAAPGMPESAPGRGEEFEAWAREHAPEELEYLRPGGKLDPTGDRAPRTRALLMRWRTAIDEPLD